MKSLLHKMLTLIIGVCFLSAYFEFNEAEKKQNYEKESHTYTTSAKETQNHSIKSPAKYIAPEFFCELSVKCLRSCQKNNKEFYPPPPLNEGRLFLRHSAFLI